MYNKAYEAILDNKINEISIKHPQLYDSPEKRNSFQKAKYVAMDIWNRITLEKNAGYCKSITVRWYKKNGDIALVHNSGNVYTPIDCPESVNRGDVLTLVSALAENSDIKGKVFSSTSCNHRDLIFVFKC